MIIAHLFYFLCLHARESGNDRIRIFQTFCFQQNLRRQLFLLQFLFHSDQYMQLIDKPVVNHGDRMNLIKGKVSAKRLCNDPDSLIIDHGKTFCQFLIGKI